MTNAPPGDIRELRYRMTRVESDLADLKGDFYRRARLEKQAPAGGYIDWRPLRTIPECTRVLLFFPLTEKGAQVVTGELARPHIITDMDYSQFSWGEPTHWAPLNMPSERDGGDGK